MNEHPFQKILYNLIIIFVIIAMIGPIQLKSMKETTTNNDKDSLNEINQQTIIELENVYNISENTYANKSVLGKDKIKVQDNIIGQNYTIDHAQISKDELENQKEYYNDRAKYVKDTQDNANRISLIIIIIGVFVLIAYNMAIMLCPKWLKP